MILLTAVLTFILGTAIGSFLSVVIYRTHKNKKGILLSRSFCPECNKKLKWRHLIPIFSWIFLRGKCGYCGKKISFHYVLLEILTGLLFLTAFLNWNFVEAIPSTVDLSLFSYQIDWHIFEKFLFYIIEFSFLVAIFFYDLMYKEIPDRFSLPAIGIAIAGGLVLGIPIPLEMLIGGVGIFAFFAIQFFASKGKWIGGGDLRLGALIGIFLGWKFGILSLIVAYLLGSIISILLLILKKVSPKTALPFGPFLIIGTIIALFFGEIILNWYSTLFLF